MWDSIAFLVPRGILGWASDATNEKLSAAKGARMVAVIPPSFAVMPGSLLACSAASAGDREPLSDRHGFFDHFKPSGLTRGIVKVGITQYCTVFTAYLSDQLKEDMNRDELVSEGRLTQAEAEQQAEEWEKREWPKRWENIYHKLLVAYGKYHAITMLMRIYEAAWFRWRGGDSLEALTVDTYQSTKRREKAGQRLPPTEMFRECWWSNLIAYLADYSVHQVILAYGYYKYIQLQRRKLKSDNEEEAQGAAKKLHPGTMALSIFSTSALLFYTRVVGLFCASVGGVIGTSILPGYGTLIGINMGDSVAVGITESVVTV